MSSTSYKAIFENNKKWIEKKKNEDIDFFDKLVKNQNPEFLISVVLIAVLPQKN